MNIKKSKFALLGKLAAITVLGTVLPAALPCFNMDTISKVHAEGELSQFLVSEFCKDKKRCFKTREGRLLVIPEGITSIEEGAFSGLYKKIRFIIFPNSLKNLDANVFKDHTSEEIKSKVRNIAVSSKCKCTGDFPENMVISKFDRSEKQSSEEFGINGELDSEAVGILSLIPKYAPNGANGPLEIPPCFNSIEHGSTVTEICINPAPAVGIHRKAVSRSFINKTVEFPEGRVNIKNGTLEKKCPAKDENGKTDVERVVIPSSCKNIEAQVFANCTNLKEIVFKGDDVILPPGPVPFVHGMDPGPGPIHRIIKGNALGSCVAETIIFPDNIEEIPDYACCGNERVTTVVLPRNCRRIGRYAFANCPRACSHKKGVKN